MTPTPRPCIIVALLLVATTSLGCRPASPGASTGTQDAALLAEARAFMDAYARELRAGDRAAIAARYDRTGAWIVIEGEKTFMPYDAIAARYAGASWSPPASFEWRDLSYEPAGSDAVVVIGHFAWARQADPAPMRISYTALLRRQDGELRIRIEDEQRMPELR